MSGPMKEKLPARLRLNLHSIGLAIADPCAWWYEDERGIELFAQRKGEEVMRFRIPWTRLMAAAKRSGKG